MHGVRKYRRTSALERRPELGRLRARTIGQAFGVSTAGQMQANVHAAANVPASVKASLTTAATPAAVAATESEALAGIQTVAAGGTPSSAQIQSGLALGSAAALSLATGMSMTAAMPVMIPIAIVVFGAGLAGGALIQSALGISNHGNYACQKASDTHAPGSPEWVHSYTPSLYDGAAHDRAGIARPWTPATRGKFETWARPILMLAGDMQGNCMPVPGIKPLSDSAQKALDNGNTLPAQQEGQGNFSLWMLGLIKVWNDANPGAPMRTITMTTPPAGYVHGEVGMDPIQGMLWQFRRTLKQYEPQYKSGAPISIQVADPVPRAARSLAFHLGPVPVHMVPAAVALRAAPPPSLAPRASSSGGVVAVLAVAGVAAAGAFAVKTGAVTLPRSLARLFRR